MAKFRLTALTSQNLTVIVSLLVSVCALVASTMQVFIMRDQSNIMLEQQKLMTEQYRASLWPRVECFFSYGDDPARFNIVLRNAGTGPALVQGVRVRYDGKIYQQWRDLFELTDTTSANSEASDTFKLSISRIHERTLAPGEETIVMGTNVPGYVKLLQANLDKLQIDLCYQSVYGASYLHTRKHRNGSAISNTQEVKSCAIPEKEQMHY